MSKYWLKLAKFVKIYQNFGFLKSKFVQNLVFMVFQVKKLSKLLLKLAKVINIVVKIGKICHNLHNLKNGYGTDQRWNELIFFAVLFTDQPAGLHRNDTRPAGGEHPRNLGHEQDRRRMGVRRAQGRPAQDPSVSHPVRSTAAG